MTINEAQVAQFNHHEYVIEASSAGLAPDTEPPAWINTDMGNGLDFILDSVNEERAVYHQLSGNIFLTLLND